MNINDIKKSDWDTVTDCAAEVCNATSNGTDESLLVALLLKNLNLLKLKYGRHPAILATEADYVDELDIKGSLLKEAYVNACELHDFKNKSYISSSLVEYYIDDIEDSIKAEYWVAIFSSDLQHYTDEYLEDLYIEFSS
jgi:hypothetical protein